MPDSPLAVRVRHATITDAPGIRMVATTTWAATYKDAWTPGNIGAFLSQNYSIEVIERRITRPGSVALVAERMLPPRLGDIVGYCFAGQHPPATPGAPPDSGEIYALYVMPAAQGQRAGYLLWQHAVQELQERGFPRIWVGVLASNQPARTFYERQGALYDHTDSVTIGDQTLPEAWYLLG